MKFRIKRTKGGFTPQVKRKWYRSWQNLHWKWGDYRVDHLTDARVVTQVYDSCYSNEEYVLDILTAAQLQPEIKESSEYEVCPYFNDNYRHFSLDGKTTSYKEGKLLPQERYNGVKRIVTL